MDDDKKIPVVLDFFKRDILMAVSAHKEASPSEVLSLDILVGERGEELNKDKTMKKDPFVPDLKLVFTDVSQITIMIQGLEYCRDIMTEARKEKSDSAHKLLNLLQDIVKEMDKPGSFETPKKNTKEDSFALTSS